MATADTYTILVTALDKASVVFHQVRQAGAAMAAPLSGFSKMLGDLGEQSGLAALAEQAEGLTQHFGGLTEAVGAMAGNLGMLGGAASAAGLIELAKHSADYGEDLYEASKKTGVAVDQLARLQYVAEQNGSSAEQMNKALEYLNKNIAEAATGSSKQMLAIFRAMHINLHDGNGQLITAAKLWDELSDKFKTHANMAQKSYVAQELMERAGKEMIPVLEMGAAAQRAQGVEFDRMHGRMTDAAAMSGHLAHESWKDLAVAAEGLGDAIGEQLTPRLMPVVQGMANFAAQHREFAADLSGTALTIATVALAAKPAMALFSFMGSSLMIVAETAAAVVAPLVEFAEGLWLGFSAMEAFDLAAAANPFGLVVLGAAAVAGAAYEIYEHWEPIKEFFVGLWDYTVQAFEFGMEHVVQYLGPLGFAVHEIYENWGPLSQFFARLMQDVVHWFEWAWQKIEPIVKPILESAEWVREKILGAEQWAASGIVHTIEGVAQHGHEILNPTTFGQAGDLADARQFALQNPQGTPPGVQRGVVPEATDVADTFANRPERSVTALPTVQQVVAQPLGGSIAAPSLDQPQMHVQIDFSNAPAGMRIQADSTGPVTHEVNVGQAWNPSY